MATFQQFYSFVEYLAEGVFDLENDTLTVALCNAANAPVAGDAVLADLTTIAYTYLSSRVLSVNTSSQTSGLYKLFLADLQIDCSGGTAATFRYVVIYDDTPSGTPTDPLIGFYDYGGDVTLGDGESFKIDFDTVTNGFLQIQVT